MKRLCSLAAIAALAMTGCEGKLSSDTIDQLLALDGEGRDGKVYMLAPEADAVVEITRADKSVEWIDVGRDPRTMERPEGSDVLYTLQPLSRTLSRIDPTGAVDTIDLGGPFNRLIWAPDGQQAIAVFDDTIGNVDITELGSLNPNAIALITDNGDSIAVRQYTLTFPPLDVVFDPGSTRALISTSERLHVLDLDTLEELAIPFTQQAGVSRSPSIVVPSGDGTRALVAVNGVADLFVVSLDPVLIENVIAIPRVPWDLAFSADEATAVIADGTSTVTFLDLDSFETESLALPHQVSRITTGGTAEAPFALLWRDGVTSSLTHVALDAGAGAPDDPETYTLADTITRLELGPGHTSAVIFHGGDYSSFVGAQSLSLFSFSERAPRRIFLDAPATDLLFIEAGAIAGSEDPHVMVVLEESARLIRYNLSTYEQVVLDTYDRPHSIGVLPAGPGSDQQLFVVHDNDLGLVSFVPIDATSVPPGGFPAVAGLGVGGLLDRR